jgi:hypothetical protein
MTTCHACDATLRDCVVDRVNKGQGCCNRCDHEADVSVDAMTAQPLFGQPITAGDRLLHPSLSSSARS